MTSETAVVPPATDRPQLAQMPLPAGAETTLLGPTWVNHEYVGGPVWATFLKSYHEAPDFQAILGRLHFGFDITLSGEDRVSRIQFYCQVADGWHDERSQIRSSAMNLLCKHVFGETGENNGTHFYRNERFVQIMRWFFRREKSRWAGDWTIRNVGDSERAWEDGWVKVSRIRNVHQFLIRLAHGILNPIFIIGDIDPKREVEQRKYAQEVGEMLKRNREFVADILAVLSTERGRLDLKHEELYPFFEAIALDPGPEPHVVAPMKSLTEAFQHGGSVTSRIAERLLLTKLYNRQFRKPRVQ